jgi:hypothetical protein
LSGKACSSGSPSRPLKVRGNPLLPETWDCWRELLCCCPRSHTSCTKRRKRGDLQQRWPHESRDEGFTGRSGHPHNWETHDR